ncbi:MAG TPA: FAD-dependent oxidoreductase [Xanthobacteraceae bacterium]|nr:FAD-dependent oxidoreductase [Xanthobacteraceae bacterium]
MSKRRALIIGGSMGGLFSAHLLRAIGWDVVVFEQENGDLAGRGAGIGTHDALHQVMARIGLPIDHAMSVVTRCYTCLDNAGRVFREVPLRRTMSSWACFYRPLKDYLPAECCHFGMRLARVEPDRDGVAAVFADGSRTRADVLIGADGHRSTVRNQFLPGVKPTYAGYIAWRAIVPEDRLRDQTRELLTDRYVFCLADDQLALAYPVPKNQIDQRPSRYALNVVWYRTTDMDTLKQLCTDSQGRQHLGSIPPPLIRPEVVAQAKEAACVLLAPQIAEIITQSEQLFFQPIYDLDSPRLVFANAVLLGDAAFVARPHVGAGVTKAALDAVCLADAIADSECDLDAALARYDRERQTFGHWVVNRGRQLGACLELGHAPQPFARDQRQRAERAMREHIATTVDIHELTVGAAAKSAS